MDSLLLSIIIGIILSILPINFPHKFPQKTTKYQKYLRSHKWRKKRTERLRKDKYTCQHCGSKVQLQVHHITYKRIYRESNRDLITLCHKCHMKEHARLNKLK